MNTFLELQTEVQSDLTIDSNSTLFPLATIKRAINRAYIKAGGLFLWPETEDAKKTSTVANHEYYDYPDNWRPDSVWKLTVDDIDYGDPLVFKDYLYEKENSIPSGASYLWSSQWRRYFIYPTPTTDGDFNISVWGQKTVSLMENDTDTTIWSYAMPECNEAVLLEAEAILKSKGEEEKAGEFRSNEAKQILIIAWGKIRQQQAKYMKKLPFFKIGDMFGPSDTSSKIGNF